MFLSVAVHCPDEAGDHFFRSLGGRVLHCPPDLVPSVTHQEEEAFAVRVGALRHAVPVLDVDVAPLPAVFTVALDLDVFGSVLVHCSVPFRIVEGLFPIDIINNTHLAV